MSRWFYAPDNRQRLGPVSSEDLRALALSGTIRPECMVMREGSEKWVPAAKIKGLFPKPAPVASPPIAAILIPCPKCLRSVPLRQHELSLLVECAGCGAQFIPSQAAAQAPPSSIPPDDPALLGLVKDEVIPVAVATPLVAPSATSARLPGRRWRRRWWVVGAAGAGILLLAVVLIAGWGAKRGGKPDIPTPPGTPASGSQASGPQWTADFDELDRWCLHVRKEIETETKRNKLRGADLGRARLGELRDGLLGNEVRWRMEVVEILPKGTDGCLMSVSMPGGRWERKGFEVRTFSGARLRGSRNADGSALVVDFNADTLVDEAEVVRELQKLGAKYQVPAPGLGVVLQQNPRWFSKDFFRLPEDRLYNLSVGRRATVAAKVADVSNFFIVKLANARIE